MGYLELAVHARPEAVEAVADLMRRYAPAGVAIEPPFAAIDEDGRIERRSDAPVRLRAWLAVDGPAPQSALDELRAALRSLPGVIDGLSTQTVEDESWADRWKQYFPVLRIGRRLVIKPSWRQYRARHEDVVVELDPGMAFGTGQHETTRMCLEALEERFRPDARVLDLGCGSGILAIGAARLGAASVDAVDIDPLAARVAAANAECNGVDAAVRIASGSLGNDWPYAELPTGRYDLLLANINSRVVGELSTAIIDALRRGGQAVVSGVVEEQEDACRAAFEAAGAQLIERRADGAWRLFVFRRP